MDAVTNGGDGKPRFEFVAVSRPSAGSRRNKQISKAVRTQVMRDYVWKKDHASTASAGRPPFSANTPEVSQFKGKFRLNVPTRKKGGRMTSKTKRGDHNHEISLTLLHNGKMRISPGPLTLLGGKYDPFDAYGLGLGRESMEVIDYCECNLTTLALTTLCL